MYVSPVCRPLISCAVSVESLHHFTKEEKTGLYRKLYLALKDGGYFILTDYFAHEDAFEDFCRAELHRLKAYSNAAAIHMQDRKMSKKRLGRHS